MITLETVAILPATAALAAGIAEIGRLLGGEGLAARWVRGWTGLWWLTALGATLLGPTVGAAIGSLVVVAAFAAWGWRERGRPRPWLVGVVGLIAGAPLVLCPPVFYDALVYHLGLPWTWLVNGSFDPIRHHVFSYFPIAAQAVFLIPVWWGLPEAAAGLHWACLVVTLAVGFGLARRLGADRWAAATPLLLLGCWHLVWVAGQPAVDLLVALAVVAAVEALTADPEPKWLDLGLACGLAAATKYPAVVPAGAVLVTALVALPRQWRKLGLAAGVATLAASFVPLRNLVLTGNPVFPLLWGVIGGTGWSARDDARWGALVHEGVGGAGSLIRGVVRLVAPPHGLGWWLLVALLLSLVAVASRDGLARRRRLVLAIAGVALVGWLVTSQTVRYAFPSAALLAVLASVGLRKLPRGLAVAATGVVAVAVVLGLLDLGRFTVGPLQAHLLWTGAATREEWRSGVTVNDPLPAYRAAARLLPPSSRLLVVGEGRSWGCPVPHHVSSPYDLQLIQELVEDAPDAEGVARSLAARGWSHLLVNWGELERLGGLDYQQLRWRSAEEADRWAQFLDAWTVPLATLPPCDLRALRAPAPVPAPGRDGSLMPDRR